MVTALAQAIIVLIGPLLGICTGPCFSDSSDFNNFGREEYEEDILGAMESDKKLWTLWVAASRAGHRSSKMTRQIDYGGSHPNF